MTSPSPTGPSERPLRVLVVAPAHMLGGQAQAARDIVRGFASEPGIEARLQPIDPRLPGRLRFLSEWKGVRSIVRPLHYLRQMWSAVPRSDLLHVFCAAHTAFLFGAVPALLVARWFGRPVVLNYHDGRAEAHLRWWPAVVRWAVRSAAEVVFPSTFLREVFRRAGVPGTVVPNVIDTSTFEHRVHHPVPPRMVSARLLEPLYAVENTLRAFALVRAEVPEARCDVYGDGVSREALERLARALGDEGITFHGAVPHDRMPAVLAEGGVLVNSSRIDNMPHVVIEAFASGMPIVSTAAGGIPHMVDDGRTGLLVPIDDPGAMAAAVLRVLREDGLARRLAAAARRECGRYSWERAREGWLAVYARAAAGDAVGERARGGDRPLRRTNPTTKDEPCARSAAR